jgi:hypothetical protein
MHRSEQHDGRVRVRRVHRRLGDGGVKRHATRMARREWANVMGAYQIVMLVRPEGLDGMICSGRVLGQDDLRALRGRGVLSKVLAKNVSSRHQANSAIGGLGALLAFGAIQSTGRPDDVGDEKRSRRCAGFRGHRPEAMLEVAEGPSAAEVAVELPPMASSTSMTVTRPADPSSVSSRRLGWRMPTGAGLADMMLPSPHDTLVQQQQWRSVSARAAQQGGVEVRQRLGVHAGEPGWVGGRLRTHEPAAGRIGHLPPRSLPEHHWACFGSAGRRRRTRRARSLGVSISNWRSCWCMTNIPLQRPNEFPAVSWVVARSAAGRSPRNKLPGVGWGAKAPRTVLTSGSRMGLASRRERRDPRWAGSANPSFRMLICPEGLDGMVPWMTWSRTPSGHSGREGSLSKVRRHECSSRHRSFSTWLQTSLPSPHLQLRSRPIRSPWCAAC